MKLPNPWITYRTRFLVQAKQLTTSLAFTDVLGRLHSGSRGDYLVESNDGVLSIARRQIFEDVYVPLLEHQESAEPQPTSQPQEPSPAREISRASSLPLHLTRKSPQPYRDRRNSAAGLRSL